jgi:hypothetical protein
MRLLEQSQEAAVMLAADAEHRSLALRRRKSVNVKFDDGHGIGPAPVEACHVIIDKE